MTWALPLLWTARATRISPAIHTRAIFRRQRAVFSERSAVDVRAISSVDFPPAPGWVVTNPPYGVRVGERRTLRNLYAQLGKTIRAKARGYTIALLSADAMLESALEIPLAEVFRARNGGIPVRLVKGSTA